MIKINVSLSTFMKLGITAVVIGTLLFVGLADEMKVTSDDIAAYISNN
ncbi:MULTISPECIES: hypothetical protein [Metabacillus]|nr:MULTISPECIES: hypothetical protein [Metabacillus]MCM3443573.1 hypothetical protein [Metabacillus halosaccharovorans]